MITFKESDFIAKSEQYFVEHQSYSVRDYKNYLMAELGITSKELTSWTNNSTFPERRRKYDKYCSLAEGNAYITLYDALSSVPKKTATTYLSAQDFKNKVEEYFNTATTYTLAGLAQHLSINRATLLSIFNPAEPIDIDRQFSETEMILIKALARIETALEEGLVEKRNVQGIIFSLKNNFGWKDKTEQDITVKDESLAQICDNAWKRIIDVEKVI